MDFEKVESQNLISFTQSLGAINPLAWIRSQVSQTKFYLKLRDQEYEWAGVDNILESNQDQAYELIKNEDQPTLKVFVANTFDLDPQKTKFILPRYEITKSPSGFQFRINCWRSEDPAPFMREFQLESPLSLDAPIFSSALKRKDKPSLEEWKPYFDKAMDFLSDHSKIVLARVTESEFDKPLDSIGLLESLKQESYRCYFKLPNGEEVVSVSPERLFRLDGKILTTEAVAGTCPLDSHPSTLLDSKKERAEHQFVVDEILRQIEPMALQVENKTTPEVVRFKKVCHLKTPIRAKLQPDVSFLNVMRALHPTPAVGGLPKIEAVHWLQINEPFLREYYAAPIGLVTKTFSEFFVNIRSVLIRDRKMKLYSGVGVVKDSTADGEWNELNLKASQFWDVLK